jgi:hypothetical protein
MSVWEKSLVHLDKLNQQLFVRLNVSNPDMKKLKMRVDFRAFAVAFDDKPPTPPIDKNKTTSRLITCEEGQPFCNPLYLLHYDFIRYSNYTLRVEAVNGDKFPLLKDSYLSVKIPV